MTTHLDAEAKVLLKERNIWFQTPFPARLRVFDNEGTVIYSSAEEATVDMAEGDAGDGSEKNIFPPGPESPEEASGNGSRLSVTQTLDK